MEHLLARDEYIYEEFVAIVGGGVYAAAVKPAVWGS